MRIRKKNKIELSVDNKLIEIIVDDKRKIKMFV
jgi:hypothetical protein